MKSSPGTTVADVIEKWLASLEGSRKVKTTTLRNYRYVEVPIGSGEGLVKAFHSTVNELDENGKTHRVQKQTAFNALLRIDEAETLGQLAQRRDQTTMTTLRRAWSREELGAAYADDAKNLRLPAGSYRVCVVMGVQPLLSKFLFDDTAGGTPQRLSWVSATYPPMPDTPTEWRGPLGWRPPRFPRTPGGDMGIDDAVRDEIVAAHLAAVRGKADGDLGGHARLVRLKLAAALAILDGRLHITADDWRLSGIMAKTSDALRNALRYGLQLEAHKRGEQQIHLAGRKRAAEIDAEEKNQEKRLEQAVQILVNRLRREGAPMTWRTLRDSLGGKYRTLRLDARAAAVERGLVVEADGVWSVP